MPKFRSLLLKTAALLFAMSPVVMTTTATAQDYPNKPVRLIIPFPPGGSNDVVGRIVATALSEQLGHQVVVDNRGGAGGVSGTEVASHAAPDGYTLLVISIAHAVNPWLYKLNYDPIKSFTPVAILGTGPNVLVVHPSLPVKDVTELLALAKQKPGELQYASAGIGSFQHLGGELFKLVGKVDILHIPFRGGGPAMTDVMGGHTKVMFSSLVQTTANIKSGRLRALGVGSKERSPVLPDVPPIAEGLPGYEALNWWGLVAPAGLPAPIVEKLNKAVAAAMSSKTVQEEFAKQGASSANMTPEEFGKFMASELPKWERVVKEGGIKAE